MIVWGGSDAFESYVNTGGAYDPATDTWTATSTANAPTARYQHTAVWTGSKMIVWGGDTYRQGTPTVYFDTGGRYDPAPSLWIDDVSVAEGNAGTATATFTVALLGVRGQTVTVSYATADGTATTADGDYLAASGTLSFDPGVTTLPVTVTVLGDAKVEANETFTLNLSNPVNAPMGDSQGLGTILNDDVPTTCTSFSISPTSANPGYPAGSQVVTITGVPSGCTGGSWTAFGNGSWLTVSPASGSGPGSATVSWAENVGVPRTDDATIAGRTFTVSQTGPGTDFFTIPPCRLVDTRLPGPSGGPILFGTDRTIPVGGLCEVSTSARAIALNLTVTAATAPGNCRLYPDPAERPQVSSINFAAGQTRANNAVVSLGPGGAVTAYCTGPGSGSVHLILDVNGYFEP
jgi:hypothetical protein